jgi:hypothetical protein
MTITVFGFKLREIQKATRPALLALLTIAVNWIASGEWSQTEFAVAASGLVVAVLAFALTNSAQFPILKAIIPPIIVNIAVLTTWIDTGSLDRPALSALVYSLVAAVLVGHATNKGLPPGGSHPPAPAPAGPAGIAGPSTNV